MSRLHLAFTLLLLGGWITTAPAENLARAARATASESLDAMTPALAVDGDADTRWSGIPGHETGVWYELAWDAPVTIAEVMISQYDRFVRELDVQAWDNGQWRTLQHLGAPNRRLPARMLVRFDPVSTTRLRITSLSGGPSYTEVAVFEKPYTGYDLTIEVASDLLGNMIGILTDEWGIEGIADAKIDVHAENGSDWKAATTTDANGMFSVELPFGLQFGAVIIRAQVGDRVVEHSVDAIALPQTLTPHNKAIDLSGTWRFTPDPPDGFWTRDFNDSDWSDIRVPAHWAMEGFQSETGVGGYRTTFPAPEGKGRKKLRFDGVYSRAEVWINGTLVAWHEGGATPFEVDITDVLQKDNVLAVRVTEETRTSTELDKMSEYADFSLAGIMRKITLFTVPDAHVGAVAWTTPGARRVVGRIDLYNESRDAVENGTVYIELFDGRERVAESNHNVSAGPWQRAPVAFAFDVPDAKSWTSETPNLYRLVIKFSGQELEYPVGFRETTIAGKEILVNGTPVKLRGTCHHDSHPLLGRAVTPEVTRRDLEMIKDANLNALRTSHYPPIPELLDIADELGLYVMDEAPFCWTHTSNDRRLLPRTIQLTAEMVARDRNHPSVFMWSLCNESTFGFCFQRSEEWIRAADPSRPLQAGLSAWLDVANLHNPISVARINQYEDIEKPMIFDEAWCIWQGIWRDLGEMWIDPGVRDYYAEPLLDVHARFVSSQTTQGGFIWAWSDDLFLVPNRGLEYGRGTTSVHFVEPGYRMRGRGIVGDAPWGVVDGWRREKPEFWITKKLQSPVKVYDRVAVARDVLRLKVVNQYDFTNLSALDIRWTLGECAGQAVCNVPPWTTGELAIALPRPARVGEALMLEFYDPTGRLVDRSKLYIEHDTDLPRVPSIEAKPLRLVEQTTLAGAGTDIIGNGFSLTFDHGGGYGDRGGGYLRASVAFGHPMLLEFPAVHLLPAADAFTPIPNRLAWKRKHMAIEREGENVRVTLTGSYPNLDGGYDYLITPAGVLFAHYRFTWNGPDMFVREQGFRLALPRECDVLQWKRNGEFTWYPDDHIGRNEGRATAFPNLPDAMPPSWPWALDPSPMGCNDFRATRRNIQWVALRYQDGPGILVGSNERQHARAIMESDRAVLHINDWYGGTNSGLLEWELNYGKGKLIRNGEVLESRVALRFSQDIIADQDRVNGGSR